MIFQDASPVQMQSLFSQFGFDNTKFHDYISKYNNVNVTSAGNSQDP